MIEYGLACLAVLLLTAWDREAMPWAVVVGGGWLSSYLLRDWPYAVFSYPVISAGTVCMMFLLWMGRITRWKAATLSVAIMMLFADVWLFASDYLGVYVGREYAMLTDIGLISMLFLIGHRGACNAIYAGADLVSGLLGRVPHLHSERPHYPRSSQEARRG